MVKKLTFLGFRRGRSPLPWIRPLRTEPSHKIIRPVCNSPDKTLLGRTFAHRFWRGKQMIVCEQTRLRAFVLAGCFIKVSLG